MRRFTDSWILIIVMLLIDLYVFQALKVAFHSFSPKIRLLVFSGYWTISVAAMVFLAAFPFIDFDSWPKALRNYTTVIFIGMFLSKTITVIFLLVDDLRRLVQWLIVRFSASGGVAEGGISRSVFLSWLGIAVGGGLMSTFLWGFTNKYNYQVKNIKLNFPNLPKAFEGLKIVQISDIHSGSFNDRKAVLNGIKTIMDQKADLILFTGDIVNNQSNELVPYKDVFANLSAPMGVFSVLGNHDYGDYKQWKTPGEKVENLQELKNIQKEMGWQLLMNEHVVFEREGEQIALLGVENWGAKARFPKYGKLDEAYAGAEKYPFKILMSHDPSHWDAQIRTEYADIDLTLSGHTHGMQFGVEVPGFKWSPVQYVYKQWAGLYEEANQKLYVNRGYGFIGYPGRVGILPEITVFELNT